MELKDYVKQYTNERLAYNWSNNIPLNVSNFDDMTLCLDSQDIDSICEYFSFLPRESITGYIASIGDGDYIEVYVTESSCPYAFDAIYRPLEYYL